MTRCPREANTIKKKSIRPLVRPATTTRLPLNEETDRTIKCQVVPNATRRGDSLPVITFSKIATKAIRNKSLLLALKGTKCNHPIP
ncbi:hypothetical protein BaRGS_00006263 [Batillaria attramentaria]|uniref:Uncharacterized protein n=1 Tax=Batillaria attramentaria TaxID=370345 RepID=A0ABD0LRV2_9CAEN